MQEKNWEEPGRDRAKRKKEDNTAANRHVHPTGHSVQIFFEETVDRSIKGSISASIF